MAETMQDQTATRKYRRKDSALGRYVAAGGSRTMAGAHSKELRLRAAARQLVTYYPVARALRFIEDLRSHIPELVRLVTPMRLVEADHSDRAEDAAQLRHLVERSPATREQWIRALYAEAAEALALARDLDAERRAP